MLISAFSRECRVQESHLSRGNPWIHMRLEKRLQTAHRETFHLFPPPWLTRLITFLFSWRSPSDSDMQEYITVTHSQPLQHDLDIIPPPLVEKCLSFLCVFDGMGEWICRSVSTKVHVKVPVRLVKGEKCWRQKELELGFVTAPNILLIYIVVCNLMD